LSSAEIDEVFGDSVTEVQADSWFDNEYNHENFPREVDCPVVVGFGNSSADANGDKDTIYLHNLDNTKDASVDDDAAFSVMHETNNNQSFARETMPGVVNINNTARRSGDQTIPTHNRQQDMAANLDVDYNPTLHGRRSYIPTGNREEGVFSEALDESMIGDDVNAAFSIHGKEEEDIDFNAFARGADEVYNNKEYYVCTRDNDGHPKIAFRVEPVSLYQSPMVYSRIDPFSHLAKEPLIVWETACPLLSCVLPDVMDNAECGEMIANLRSLLRDTKFSECDGFWSDISLLDREILYDVYRIVQSRLKIANGYIGTYNPVLSFCTGSHNNTVMLGSDQQAKGAVFYVCPYMSKEKTTLHHTASLIEYAICHVKQHKSVSPDSRDPSRDAKQLLQRIMNQMNLHMELSDYQIAAALIGIPSILRTDIFSYLNPECQMGYRSQIQMHEDRERRNDAMMNILNSRIDSQEGVDEVLASFIVGGSNDTIQNEGEMPKRPVYSAVDLRREMGYLEHMVVGHHEKKKRTVFIPKAAFYANRGKGLRSLNLIEYHSLIQYTKKTKSENEINQRFPFATTIECCSDYDQMLVSKHKTILVLQKPPSHPGKEPSEQHSVKYKRWKGRADIYARFYLTLYRPEVDCYSIDMSNNYQYTWEALRQFEETLSNDHSVLSKFRLMSMHCRMRGFYTTYESKVMLTRFRARNRDEWDNTTKVALLQERRMQNMSEERYNDRIPEHDLSDEHKLLSSACNKTIDNILRGTEKLIYAYRATQPKDHTNVRRASRIQYGDLEATIVCERKSGDIQMFARRLRNANPSGHRRGVLTLARNLYLHHRKVYEHRKWVNLLKSRQREVYEVFRMYIKNPSEENKPPLITWVNGAAGTGKSELIRRILVYTELKFQGTVRTAFNGINALHIGGQTTASLLHFTENDPKIMCALEPAQFNEFKEHVLGARLILIDEFSNQAPWHIAKFSSQCQRVTGNYDLPFGGIPVIMGGDLGQMGPVKVGKSIAKAILDICLNVWNPDT
jgi:hypothetical protein